MLHITLKNIAGDSFYDFIFFRNRKRKQRICCKEINCEVINLFPKIRSRDFSEMHSDSPWVIVTPTYAWRIPRIVAEWLKNTNLVGNKDIYFVMTCDGIIGNAGKYMKKLPFL